MIDLLIKYPTRERPEKFKQVLKMYISMLSGKHKVKFVVSMDKNDSSCNNQNMRNFLESMKAYVDLEYVYGVSKNKVDACNRDIPTSGWKVCLLISDDMIPEKHSYDDDIITDMMKFFPDLDGCLNYNCGFAYPSVMVLCVIGNVYYNKFGYIYHPDYISLYCDEEQTVIAKSTNKIVNINKKIIDHRWGEVKDSLRQHTEKFSSIDKKMFEHRKAKGFPK